MKMNTEAMELVKAFDAAMPEHMQAVKASHDKRIAAGQMEPQQFAVTDITGGFCKNWPAWKKAIGTAMWIIKYLAPAVVAAAIMGLMAMADAAYAKACAIPPAE
jgi:hypothetical protein